MYALDINKLSVTYNDKNNHQHKIIDNLSIQIKKQTFNMIIGKNGSGKTTLIKAIIKLINYNGNIKILGQSFKDAIQQKLIGYVPQHNIYNQNLNISVLNILKICSYSDQTHLLIPSILLSKKYKLQKEQIKNNINNIVNQFQIKHILNKNINNISGGERQRLFIAQSLVKEHKLLLLDEPFNNIDEESHNIILTILKELTNIQDITILLVTHDIKKAKQYCNRCINMDTKTYQNI